MNAAIYSGMSHGNLVDRLASIKTWLTLSLVSILVALAPGWRSQWVKFKVCSTLKSVFSALSLRTYAIRFRRSRRRTHWPFRRMSPITWPARFDLQPAMASNNTVPSSSARQEIVSSAKLP